MYNNKLNKLIYDNRYAYEHLIDYEAVDNNTVNNLFYQDFTIFVIVIHNHNRQYYNPRKHTIHQLFNSLAQFISMHDLINLLDV